MNIPYLLFGNSIKRRLARDEMRPQSLSGLTFGFLDLDGHEYYVWPSPGALPPKRERKVEDLALIASAGKDTDAIAQLTGLGEAHLHAAIKEKTDAKRMKHLTDIGLVFRELNVRNRDIIPEETYYQLAAVMCCRSDEDPMDIDESIQAQKVEAFKKAATQGAAFFLTNPALVMLLGTSLVTERGFRDLLTSWSRTRTYHQSLIQALSSDLNAQGSETTGKDLHGGWPKKTPQATRPS